jgi:hypothetical protein
VADQRSSIDLTTLAEVQRLLASTEFASIDDLARRNGVIDLDEGLDRSSAPLPTRTAAIPLIDGGGPTTLPRRR